MRLADRMKLKHLSILLFLTFISAVNAQETKPAPTANLHNFILVDCVSWQKCKLICKIHMDEHFDAWIASNVSYHRIEKGLHGALDHATAGQTYIITFEETGNAPLTHIKSATLIDPAHPPKEIPEDSLIGKIIEVKDKDATGKDIDPKNVNVIVHFEKDDNVKKFFSKERMFSTYPIQHDFRAGQVIKIPLDSDNRHCRNEDYVAIEDKPAATTKP